MLVADLMGVRVTFECEAVRVRPDNSEVDRLFACHAAATERMNWHPEFGGVEGFRRGLKSTIDWFSDPSNLAFYKAQIYNV
jgi:hypothetical protein